jgi:hypothetical protein
VTSSVVTVAARGGGGIGNLHGTLTVTDSTFSGNDALAGGAIENYLGRLSVARSTLSGNSAGIGGSMANAAGGTLVVRDCALANNYADDAGGGIYNEGGVTVTNSTFSGNDAFFAGGAIENFRGTLSVTSSTISGNGADSGAGLSIESGTVAVSNTIIANSLTGGDCAEFEGAIVVDGGHNLVEDSMDACGLVNGTNGNLVGVDPLLAPAGLKDNGGPTQTIALLAGSPAIGAGDPEVCADAPVDGLDQRGYVRPGVGHGQCSIGAYEADAIPPACTGDCDGNGMVAINELILGVNIALGLEAADACPAFTNADGMVDIAQLITGVNNALGGCGSG